MKSDMRGLISRILGVALMFATLWSVGFSQTYTITVAVHDTQGGVIPDVLFTVDGAPHAATRDASQRYVLEGLESGVHFVEPGKPGWRFAADAQGLTLPTSGQTDSPDGFLDFTGYGAYAITGQVYRVLGDGRRQGIRHVTVTRTDTGTTVSTDVDGRYRFGALGPGSYPIHVGAPGFTAAEPDRTVTLAAQAGDANNDGVVNSDDFFALLDHLLGRRPATGDADRNGDGRVDVADVIRTTGAEAGAPATDFEVTPAGRISGRLTDGAGGGIAGVRLVAVGSDASGGMDVPFAEGTSDGEGRFTLEGLVPGIYSVIPVDPGRAFAPASASLTIEPGSTLAEGGLSFAEDAGNEGNSLVSTAYLLVEDSDGWAVSGDGIGMLLFEPNGVVDLYLSIVTDAIAYQGTYAYRDGQLTVDFPTEDFRRHATFALDTSQTTVTMPFKVFNDDGGSSTWTRYDLSLSELMTLTFRAATLGEDQCYFDQAMTRLMACARLAMATQSAGPSGLPKLAAAPRIKLVIPMMNGVELNYEDGEVVQILLYGRPVSPTTTLTASPLASDPRLNLDVEPADEDFDPPHRTALLLSPFFNATQVDWYDALLRHRRVSPNVGYQAYRVGGFDASDHMSEIVTRLEAHDYACTLLTDEMVSLPRLIDELLESPGIIIYSTHGSGNGGLLTGTYLGNTVVDKKASVIETYKQMVRRYSANSKYSAFMHYARPGEIEPTTTTSLIQVEMDLGTSANPAGSAWYVVLRPCFWEALRVNGNADFSQSLFFASACLTDLTPDLREAVRARAYFAFNIEVLPKFAAAVMHYLVRQMGRRTHSAEEAYYNILRIASTHQMIYTEDALFQNAMPEMEADRELNPPIAGGDRLTIKDVFKAYGTGVTTREILPYQGNGWLTGNRADFNPGVVWWVLFGSRWGGEAEASRDALMNVCWEPLWSQGKTGGLANQGCQNMSSGRAPYPPEFSYVAYLLTGSPYQFPCPTLVPRWTLDDRR